MVDEERWIRIALRHPDDDDEILPWEWLFSQIDYFGKRGGFFQFVDYDAVFELPTSFTLLTQPTGGFSLDGLMQLVDDCGAGMTFAHADVFDSQRLSLNTENGRLLKVVVLPYQQIGAGRSFTAYQRLESSS